MHRSRINRALIAAPVLALGLGLLAQRAPAGDWSLAASTERNGQHDFDFLFGHWKLHLKRKVPGTDRWTESDGHGIYRKVWGGRANLNEFFSENPHDLEGLTLRTYNPVTHLWSLYWANSREGILSSAQVGKFDHGRGEFYAQDNSNGKGTLVRYVWSKITPNSAHFEQAFSENGGNSWEVNWISDMMRIGDAEEPSSSSPGTVAEQPGQRDFEPLLGRWNFHLKVRLKLGSTQWTDYTGPGECIPLWHGRAQLDTINLQGPTKHIEGLTVRLFNPKTHEWRLYWANSRDGLIVVPQIGQFKAGHGEFYTQDQDADDRTFLNKFDWSAMMSKPHFEQSVSYDGGKNWEVNWISDQTRVN